MRAHTALNKKRRAAAIAAACLAVICAAFFALRGVRARSALLESGAFEQVTVMVQKEAAARLCAAPGSKECGAVSVAVHYRSKPQVLFPVGRGSFMPPPKVDSAVIRLDVLQQPPVAVEDEKWFFQVARGAFAQRRKTAANSISATLGVPKPQVEQALLAAGVAANIRAERLALEQLAALAGALGESLPLASRGKTV